MLDAFENAKTPQEKWTTYHKLTAKQNINFTLSDRGQTPAFKMKKKLKYYKKSSSRVHTWKMWLNFQSHLGQSWVWYFICFILMTYLTIYNIIVCPSICGRHGSVFDSSRAGRCRYSPRWPHYSPGASKCQVLHISRSRRPIKHSYTLSLHYAWRKPGLYRPCMVPWCRHLIWFKFQSSHQPRHSKSFKTFSFLKRNIKTKHPGIRL